MNIDQEISQPTPTLLYFYTDWFLPSLTILEMEIPTISSKINTVIIDGEKEQELIARFKISKLPTFVLFQANEVLARHEGMLQETLESWISTQLQRQKDE